MTMPFNPTGSAKFKLEDGRLWRKIKSTGDDGIDRESWVAFASELRVLAQTRDRHSQEWGLLVEIIDRDGSPHRWELPNSHLIGTGDQIRAELLRRGIWFKHGRQTSEWLMEYLTTANPAQRARSVPNTGWFEHNFVLPDEVIGDSSVDEAIILQGGERLDHNMNVAGTAVDWRENVGRLCKGNSRLILAVSAAFAAPLLYWTAENGGGFHFRGASSSGKSTALIVAGSVWGGGAQGFVQNWRVTENGLEVLASLHNHALLCLDELSQIDARALAQAVYMLANGKGKARAAKDASLRKTYSWALTILSSGEIGFTDKLRENGGRSAAGLDVRIVDLRADAGAGLGLFQHLHDMPDAASFAQELKAAAMRYYGAPAREFLRQLLPYLQNLPDQSRDYRANFIDASVPQDADGQVKRVATRFALVAMAGELATEFGLTGWQVGAATEAAQACFIEWLRERGGNGAAEIMKARQAIMTAIERDGQSRFVPWKADTRPFIRINTLGYVRCDEETGERTYYLHKSGMAELLGSLDRRSVVNGLAEQGVIVRREMMRKGRKIHVVMPSIKVPSEGTNKRLYEISRSFLNGELDNKDD